MSRLDSMIHRLIAQRDLLNRAADLVSGVEGPVLELGLGNGRTYSHLKALFPDREVFAFDRQTVASIRSMPDAEHMILGEIRDTLPYCAPRIGGKAVLVHADLSNGDPTDDLARAAWLTPALVPLVAKGGVIVCGHALAEGHFTPMRLPESVAQGRYYFYTAGEGLQK